MCRLAAYLGPAIPLQNIVASPAHSLLHQSMAASEALLPLNGDGFGICWYGLDAEPGRYVETMPAWSDSNLKSVCRMICAPLFLAHVRASTIGETTRANCHPFVHKQWSFMHNGNIPHVQRIRRQLESTLPDDIYAQRQGTTDSELFFQLLVAYGINNDVETAWNRTIAAVLTDHSPLDGPVRIVCVLSDGHQLYAFRYSSDRNSPSLYHSVHLDNDGFAFASEPLDACKHNWEQIPENSFAVINNLGITISSLDHCG